MPRRTKPTESVLRPLLVVLVGLALVSQPGAAEHAGERQPDGRERPALWWDPHTEGSAFARYTTETYALITDLPPTYAELILGELERNLLLYRDVLACLDLPEAFPQRLRMRIFASLPDYQAYHREHWNQSIGASFAYHHTSEPETREAVGFFVAREPFFAGLRHEGFHQVFRHVVEYPPQWINEGLAEYCEAARWCDEAQRFEPRLHAGWARQLREFIGEGRRYRFVEAEELLRMSKQAWNAEAASTYAGSWALVWLLRHEFEGGRDLLERYLTALEPEARRKRNERRAWRETFGGPDAQRLDGVSERYERFQAEVVPTPEYTRFREAVAWVLAREYTAAEPLLTQVIAADESFYPAFYYRAVVRRAHDRPEAALDDLVHAIAEFPQYTSAIRVAIPLALELGQLELAAHLAVRLECIGKRFAPQARHWQRQIDAAREQRRGDDANENGNGTESDRAEADEPGNGEDAPQGATAPRTLPSETGWPRPESLEEEKPQSAESTQ